MISQIAPWSDAPATVAGLEVGLGFKAAIKEADQRGCVNGLRIRQVVLDGKFKPDSAGARTAKVAEAEPTGR